MVVLLRVRDRYLCVVDQIEFTKLKQLVKALDPSAFVVVMDASEVLGEGFKRSEKGI